MALSRPLLVALVAFGLLAGSVGFEVVFHRSYFIDVRDGAGWQTIGQSRTESLGPTSIARANHVITAERGSVIEFRVRVDNGYPWSFSHHYDVVSAGLIVGGGTLAAGARDVGESSFPVPASSFFANGGPSKESGTNTTFAYLTVEIGSTQLSGNFQLQEAGR